MPTPSLIVLGAAVAAKAVSTIWLVSIATSPSAIGSRKRFIEHSTEALDNLIEVGRGPDPTQLSSLRSDLSLLEKHVKDGWHETHVFGAASRVSAWKAIEHAKGAISGGTTLIGNMAKSAKDWVWPGSGPDQKA